MVKTYPLEPHRLTILPTQHTIIPSYSCAELAVGQSWLGLDIISVLHSFSRTDARGNFLAGWIGVASHPSSALDGLDGAGHSSVIWALGFAQQGTGKKGTSAQVLS